VSNQGQQRPGSRRRHGRYGRGSYPEALHLRVPEGTKDLLEQLGQRFNRDLSDEGRVAIFSHLRRHGMGVPGQDDPAPPRPLLEVVAELEALAATARELLEQQQGPGQDEPGRRSAAG
jgi:hypothetical protein